MEPFHQIISKEFKDRARENYEGFYALCDFLIATSTTPDDKRQALGIIDTMHAQLEETMARILKA